MIDLGLFITSLAIAIQAGVIWYESNIFLKRISRRESILSCIFHIFNPPSCFGAWVRSFLIGIHFLCFSLFQSDLLIVASSCFIVFVGMSLNGASYHNFDS